MRSLVAAALVFLSACRCNGPSVGGTGEGGLRVRPSALDFGEVWRGSSKRLSVSLANSERASVPIELELAPPFTTATASFTLGGGEETPLEIGFTPTAEGPVEAELSIRHPLGVERVTLSGKGIAPPPCEPSLCRSARLDPETGQCVQLAIPDDTTCATSCLIDGRCQGGSCVGTPRSCDDHDPCTLDLCDTVEGCRHEAVQCAPSGPCSSPACAPDAGCVEAPVPDGTACGPADCSEANVCIGGACVKRQVPEGAPCGVESLCQSRGRCVSGRCDQPDASVLLPEWAYEPSVSGIDLVGLVADGRGDFFTVECQPFGLGTFTVRCSLVSFSPTGQERWRTPFPRNLYVGTGALTDSLTVAEESVISWVERSFVSAFDVTTGAHRWTTNLATNGAFPSGVGWVRMRALSADGAGRLSIAAEGYSPNGGVFSSAYVELDAVTGALLRTHPLPHEGFSLLQDRRAVTSVAHALQPAGAQLREAVSTFDQGGQLRWQRVVPISNLRVRTLSATHQGLLAVTQLDQLELLDASNGALTRQVRLPGNAFGAPVWSDRRFFSFLQVCLRSPCRSFPEFDYQLLALDVRTASSAGAFLPPLNDLSSPWLTQRGTPLFTVWTRAGWAELFEFDEAASLVMRCPLPRFVGALGSGPVLTDGRYGILTRRDSSGGGRISVWALPGYRPAASGWISGGGGPGHDGRAR